MGGRRRVVRRVSRALDRGSGIAADLEDSFGKGVRSFLRQIVPYAALDGPMRIFARELFGVGAGLRMRRTVGVTLQRDSRHVDQGKLGKALFQIVILRLPLGQAEPPAIVVHDDGDM